MTGWGGGGGDRVWDGVGSTQLARPNPWMAFASDPSLKLQGSPGGRGERDCERGQGKPEEDQESFMREKGCREEKPAFTQGLWAGKRPVVGCRGPMYVTSS